MSYRSWTDYGYGISTMRTPNKIEPERVKALLALAPKTAESFRECLGEDEIGDLEWYESKYGSYGAFGLLCDVMEEKENIRFFVCSDYDDERYILYPPKYPWELKDDERLLTKKDRVKQIFDKYTSILYGEPIPVDYYSCENGG